MFLRRWYHAFNVRRWFLRIVGGAVTAIILFLLCYSYFFGPADRTGIPEQVLIAPGTEIPAVAAQLEEQGFVNSEWALRFALVQKAHGRPIRPGAYMVSKDMDVLMVARVLVGQPTMAFVTFPSSIRKEQMGEILAESLGWSEEEIREWNTIATEPDPDFREGVYFPDTYLIPTDQSPSQVAARMRGRFTDVFAPYADQAREKGIAWTDVLTLASIVDREASKTDRELVAAILWNRLDIGMRLQADATLQYIRGAQGNWWPVPTSADKYLESEFNTYMYAGLPPHPINNPTLESIAAVLNPQPTNCIYYLHDADHQIHCALTYAEHENNIDAHLR